MFHCHVPKHMDCPLIPDLQQALNNDHTKLLHLISELRYWITSRRCEKTLQHLPAMSHENLPLRFTAANEDKMKKLGKHRVFIKLHRHPSVVLIVELKEKPDHPSEMEYTFYLAQGQYEAHDSSATPAAAPTTAVAAGNPPTDASDPPNTEPAAKLFFKVNSIIELDTFVNTHGPGTYVDEVFVSNAANLAALAGGAKRKAEMAAGPALKQPKTIYPAYFIPELAHIVAMCDEKFHYVSVAKELSSLGIPNSGLQVEANATTLGLKILGLPKPTPSVNATDEKKVKCNAPPAITAPVWTSLTKRLLGTTIRLPINRHNLTRSWALELVFYSTPFALPTDSTKSLRKPVYFHYDVLTAEHTGKTIQLILEGWARIVYLYALVHDFAEAYKSGECERAN